jgi:hypothetical protein
MFNFADIIKSTDSEIKEIECVLFLVSTQIRRYFVTKYRLYIKALGFVFTETPRELYRQYKGTRTTLLEFYVEL